MRLAAAADGGEAARGHRTRGAAALSYPGSGTMSSTSDNELYGEGIAPGAGNRLKVWEADRFAAVAGGLLDEAERFVQDDRSMNIFNVFYSPTGMTRDELKTLQKEAYRRFYGRPQFMGRKLRYLRHPDAMRRNFTLASHLGRHLMGF